MQNDRHKSLTHLPCPGVRITRTHDRIHSELCAIVDKDRKTDNAKKAEDEVLLKLRQRKFGDSVDMNGNLIDPSEERQRNRVMAETIEAFC